MENNPVLQVICLSENPPHPSACRMYQERTGGLLKKSSNDKDKSFSLETFHSAFFPTKTQKVLFL